MHSNKRGEQYGSCMEVDNTDKALRLQIRKKKKQTEQLNNVLSRSSATL